MAMLNFLEQVKMARAEDEDGGMLVFYSMFSVAFWTEHTLLASTQSVYQVFQVTNHGPYIKDDQYKTLKDNAWMS